MRLRLLRPFLILEFLIAVQVVFTVWSQVGGQYHLDLMFWPWKLGVGLGSALLITAITANVARAGGGITRRALLYGSLLILTLFVAGVVTYYYHLNEPPDEDQNDPDTPAMVTRMSHESYNEVSHARLSCRYFRCAGFRSVARGGQKARHHRRSR